jgi:hypothetical protein
VGTLEDPGGLLADLVQRSLHDGLARLPPLELGDELEHLLHEGVDGVPVVPAHGQRKITVRDPLRRAAAEAAGFELGRIRVGHTGIIPARPKSYPPALTFTTCDICTWWIEQ